MNELRRFKVEIQNWEASGPDNRVYQTYEIEALDFDECKKIAELRYCREVYDPPEPKGWNSRWPWLPELVKRCGVTDIQPIAVDEAREQA